MKLLRCRHQQRELHAVLKEMHVVEVENLFARPLRYTGVTLSLSDVELLTPCDPRQIVCAGINYRAHAQDGHSLPERPHLFLKPASSTLATNQTIPFPSLTDEIGFEGELAVVISRRTHNIGAEEALDYVLGYCCANDLSARDIQRSEQNYGAAKSFSGFCPFGPWLETEFDPTDFTLETRVDSLLSQRSGGADLLFSVAELISYISQIMVLDQGDLILTGTPPGMGIFPPGSEVQVTVSGIGTLSNRLALSQRQSFIDEVRRHG